MLHIHQVNPLTDKRWDNFVSRHPFGWLCHTSTWVQILQSAFKHIRPKYLALVNESTSEIIAALPLCYVKSYLIGNRMVSLPLATLCDPLVHTADQLTILLASATELQNTTGSKHIEVRAFKSLPLLTQSPLTARLHYKHHYLPLNRDIRTIKAGIKRTCRQCIRGAQEAPIEIHEGTSQADISDFYRLYVRTKKRTGGLPLPYRYIYLLWETMRHAGFLTLLVARYKGATIAGIILFKYKDRVSAEYLVTDENYFHLRPNHLLIWESIKYASENGYSFFDFGRTAPDHSGLLRFKKGWGTNVTDLCHYYYPSDVRGLVSDQANGKYRVLLSLSKRLPDYAFCAFASFCHRHLG